MSGGAYNYLYTRSIANDAIREDIRAVGKRLVELECPQALLLLRDTVAHVVGAQEAFEKLVPVLKAVEWLDSGDWGEEQFRAALEEWREKQ